MLNQPLIKHKSMTKRNEARKVGLKRYIGEECKYGHTERYTSSGCCVECDKIKTKEKWQKKLKTRAQNAIQ